MLRFLSSEGTPPSIYTMTQSVQSVGAIFVR
jgi:hypothetical protein